MQGPVQEWEVNATFRARPAKYKREENGAHLDLLDITRATNHLNVVDLRRFSDNTGDDKLKQLRIKYLQSKISEDKWTSEIKTLHRISRKNGEYMAILGGAPEILQELIRAQIRLIQMGYPINLQPLREFGQLVQTSLDQVNARWNVKGYELPAVLVRPHLSEV